MNVIDTQLSMIKFSLHTVDFNLILQLRICTKPLTQATKLELAKNQAKTISAHYSDIFPYRLNNKKWRLELRQTTG